MNQLIEIETTVIEQRLETVIHGKMEGATLYTNAFVERQSSLIRGIFSAITQYLFWNYFFFLNNLGLL